MLLNHLTLCYAKVELSTTDLENHVNPSDAHTSTSIPQSEGSDCCRSKWCVVSGMKLLSGNQNSQSASMHVCLVGCVVGAFIVVVSCMRAHVSAVAQAWMVKHLGATILTLMFCMRRQNCTTWLCKWLDRAMHGLTHRKRDKRLGNSELLPRFCWSFVQERDQGMKLRQGSMRFCPHVCSTHVARLLFAQPLPSIVGSFRTSPPTDRVVSYAHVQVDWERFYNVRTRGLKDGR